MECFGTIDFDNNSRSITLSAIIISGLHCIRTVARKRWRRRSKQLLYDFKEKRGYWKLKEEALDRTLWRNGFRRGYEPVLRHATEWMNTEWCSYICYGFASVTEGVKVRKGKRWCVPTLRGVRTERIYWWPFFWGANFKVSGSKSNTAHLFAGSTFPL